MSLKKVSIIKFVWCSYVNISAFTSLHILPVKLYSKESGIIKSQHPKSLQETWWHVGVCCALSVSEHTQYTLNTKIAILHMKKWSIIPLLQTHNGHVYYVYYVCWWFTFRYALWFLTRCLGRRKSCKFQHGFNDRMISLQLNPW